MRAGSSKHFHEVVRISPGVVNDQRHDRAVRSRVAHTFQRNYGGGLNCLNRVRNMQHLVHDLASYVCSFLVSRLVGDAQV